MSDQQLSFDELSQSSAQKTSIGQPSVAAMQDQTPQPASAPNPPTGSVEQDATDGSDTAENAEAARSTGTDFAARGRAAGRAKSHDTSSKREPKTPSAGDELECRLARMYFWQGSYARRGINLQHHFYPEPLLVTDLDLLAYDISPQLELVKTIGEAKSGTGKTAPKPLDRAIWLAGLMKVVDADRASLVTALNPSSRVRDTARGLGVRAISVADLDRWEATWLPNDLEDCGSQGLSAFQETEKTRLHCKAEADLERVFWFLRSEVWFLDEWQATKRIIGAINRLNTWWTPHIDDETTAALRWLYAEALSILALNVVALTGRSWTISDSEWPAMVRDRLSEGAVPAHHMRALGESFDRYLSRALSAANVSKAYLVESMGAFHPSPPEWTDPLIELIERLSSSACLVDLPRHTDLIIHERLVRRRHVRTEALDSVSRADHDSLAHDRRLLAAFLRACGRLPDAVSKALTT